MAAQSQDYLYGQDGLPEQAALIAQGQAVTVGRNDGRGADRGWSATAGCGRDQLLQGLGFEIVAVSAATASHVASAYAQWGKGAHPAGLNFGDRFANALARERGCRLLFVGDDFSRTDVLMVP